ncbi:uncharacterized protein [Littorina saxatilis]|uniref:uncharacterized protein n=1 Tax=Littorina saxatilis TaxID=31220 RepID=UPI0038B6A996
MGKAKVAPKSGNTIPRLELCSAVLATDLWQLISEQLDVVPKSVTFYTDSKVILGYINNEKRRFYTYVSNRVERIRRVTDPQQWKYIPTDSNPADVATRYTTEDLGQKESVWLHGSGDLFGSSLSTEISDTKFPLVAPDADSEVRACVCKTEVADVPSSLTSRFEKFSSWETLVNSLSILRHTCRSFSSPSESCKGWHQCSNHRDADSLRATEAFIISAVQKDALQR